jgi:GNAT superfamily N-acetyltransferase
VSDDLRLMQGLAQEVDALAPELANSDATVGELAWVWGKDHADQGHRWRRRLWYEGGSVAAWGWIFLPYQVARTDGRVLDVPTANLAWQVHPDHPELLDDILDWYDAEVPEVDHRTNVRAAGKDALARLAAHGYHHNPDDDLWVQLNGRDLTELADPVLPSGFRFRTADEVGPEAAVRAHRDAWYPSSFTEQGFDGVRRTWPYRADLHVLIEAPDGTLVATAIMWLDERNRTAEFEPVGTHREYRRQGLGSVLLQHGMHRARAAGATRMLVTCLGAPGYPAARDLYTGVGFREFTRDLPHVKRAR